MYKPHLQIALLASVLAAAATATAATFYVDRHHPQAADSNGGSADEPWLTIGHAIANVAPGDTILVTEGIYRETLKLSINGLAGQPITLAGRPGHRVVISGADELAGFAPCTEAIAKGNPNFQAIYYTDLSWRPANLYQDGVPLARGRTPADGWWNVESSTASTITDTAHLTQSDGWWTGAQLFIWRLSATQQYIANIIDSSQAAATVTYDSLKYVPEIGDRYYLRNKVELIGGDGQWAVEDLGGGVWRVYLWPGGNADPNACLIEGPTPARAGTGVIDVFKQSYWTFDNLEIRHGVSAGIGGNKDVSAGHITVSNCSVHHNEGAGLACGYNHNGLYRRNYIAYNGGIDNVGISMGASLTGLVVEENEIAFNGKDGVRFNGNGVTVRRNYIHGHWFWQHADNCQTYGGASNVLIEQNLVINGGQNFMMDSLAGITFRGNVIAGSRGNMLIFGHDGCADAAVIGNTFFFPGGSVMDTSGGNGYFLRNNISVTGKLTAAWGASSSMTYDSDYNLFCFAEGVPDTAWRVVLWDANWTSRGLAEYVNASGHDTHSAYGYPMFLNAPKRYVNSDGGRLADLTETRTYVDASDAYLFVVGEHIELDWDGVVRTIMAVGTDYVEFAPPEPRLRLKAPVICLWGDNTDFTLDLRLDPASPAIGAAADGGDLGSPINTVQFARGDFDGDGLRNIPTWLEDPAAAWAPLDLPGDANRDGIVDIADFVALKNNFGLEPATWGDGDFNGDGRVGIADFVILKNNFGATAAAPPPAEPVNLSAAAAPPPPGEIEQPSAPVVETPFPRDLLWGPDEGNADADADAETDADADADAKSRAEQFRLMQRLRRERMERARNSAPSR